MSHIRWALAIGLSRICLTIYVRMAANCVNILAGGCSPKLNLYVLIVIYKMSSVGRRMTTQSYCLFQAVCRALYSTGAHVSVLQLAGKQKVSISSLR